MNAFTFTEAVEIADESLKIADAMAAVIPKGARLASVLSACLTISAYIGKQQNLDKLQIQELFVSIWDKTGNP